MVLTPKVGLLLALLLWVFTLSVVYIRGNLNSWSNNSHSNSNLNLAEKADVYKLTQQPPFTKCEGDFEPLDDVQEDDIVNSTSKLRVLFLTTKLTFDVMMDRHYYFMFDAAIRHQFVDAVMWGKGFSEWDPYLSAEQNIITTYGRNHFHIIQLWGGYTENEILMLSQLAPISYRFGCDCWDNKCSQDLTNWNISIAQFCYAQEMSMYSSLSHRRVFVHSPNSADPKIFYPGYMTQPLKRDIPILLIGALSKDIFPMRERLKDMIEDGLFPGAVIREHPGYTEYLTEEEAKQKEVDVLWHANQYEEYASQLMRAKITLVTSSIYRYALQKFSEAAMAGSLILGEIPLEREDEFKKYVVPLLPTDSDEDIVKKVNYWLEHDTERETRAKIGQKINLNHYTWKNNVRILIEAYRKFRRKEFGLWYPYPFSVGCQGVNPDQPSNPWCPEGGNLRG
eukprot:TRINITY_DN1303_c0_g1_i1.p1 TRINITY_DN1303_c0_g1~~TRINITY_DN1303_c0_g1_i1.p1  ORF type:complete len:451 (-),score=48.18 TRINITY_DN1303_c0_g1_i1:95-1447(-)